MRATTTLGEDLIPALDKTWDVLMKECDEDAKKVQQVLELMVVRHCARMGSEDSATYVARHVHRHIQQLLLQLFEGRNA